MWLNSKTSRGVERNSRIYFVWEISEDNWFPFSIYRECTISSRHIEVNRNNCTFSKNETHIASNHNGCIVITTARSKYPSVVLCPQGYRIVYILKCANTNPLIIATF